MADNDAQDENINSNKSNASSEKEIEMSIDALVVAKKKNVDIFSALDVMQNKTFLKKLKFGPGNGSFITLSTTIG